MKIDGSKIKIILSTTALVFTVSLASFYLSFMQELIKFQVLPFAYIHLNPFIIIKGFSAKVFIFTQLSNQLYWGPAQ